MSSSYRKIKYTTEGSYGSVDEATLYIKSNASTDITSVYDEHGNELFSFSESGDFDMGKALIALLSSDWDLLDKPSKDELIKINI